RSSQRPPAGRAEGSARRWSSTTKLRHVIPLRLPSPIGAPSVSEKRSSTARRLWRGRLLSHPNPVSSRPRRRRSNRRAGVRGPSIDPIPICSEEVGYLSPPASSTRAPTRGWTRSLTGEVDRRRLGYRTRTPPSSCAPLTSSLRPSSSTTTTRPGRVSPEATSSILLRYIWESEELRRAMEPVDLIRRVKEIEQEAYGEHGMATDEDPKQTAAVDLSKRLKDLRAGNDGSSQK
ncbi:hypothetical protein ACJX0J_021437, partial [Zea mays]